MQAQKFEQSLTGSKSNLSDYSEKMNVNFGVKKSLSMQELFTLTPVTQFQINPLSSRKREFNSSVISRVSETSSQYSASVKSREPRFGDNKKTLAIQKTPKTFDSDKSMSSHFNHSKSPIREIIPPAINANNIPSFGAIKSNEKVHNKEVYASRFKQEFFSIRKNVLPDEAIQSQFSIGQSQFNQNQRRSSLPAKNPIQPFCYQKYYKTEPRTREQDDKHSQLSSMSEEELKNYDSDVDDIEFKVQENLVENQEFTNYFDIVLDLDSKTKLQNQNEWLKQAKQQLLDQKTQLTYKEDKFKHVSASLKNQPYISVDVNRDVSVLNSQDQLIHNGFGTSANESINLIMQEIVNKEVEIEILKKTKFEDLFKNPLTQQILSQAKVKKQVNNLKRLLEMAQQDIFLAKQLHITELALNNIETKTERQSCPDFQNFKKQKREQLQQKREYIQTVRKQQFSELANDEDNQEFFSQVIDADLSSIKNFVMFIANLGDTLTIKTLNLIVKGLQFLDVNPLMFQHNMHGVIFTLESKLILAEHVMAQFVSS